MRIILDQKHVLNFKSFIESRKLELELDEIKGKKARFYVIFPQTRMLTQLKIAYFGVSDHKIEILKSLFLHDSGE